MSEGMLMDGHTPWKRRIALEEENRIREAALDETIAASFPASDPPSSIPNPYEQEAASSGGEPANESRSRS